MPAQLSPVAANRRVSSRRNSGDLLPWADPYIASLFDEVRSKPTSQEGEAEDREESGFDLADARSHW